MSHFLYCLLRAEWFAKRRILVDEKLVHFVSIVSSHIKVTHVQLGRPIVQPRTTTHVKTNLVEVSLVNEMKGLALRLVLEGARDFGRLSFPTHSLPSCSWVFKMEVSSAYYKYSNSLLMVSTFLFRLRPPSITEGEWKLERVFTMALSPQHA